MKRGAGRLAVIAVAMAFLMGMAGGRTLADCTCLNDDCYEDLAVAGAGTPAANGTYRFVSLQGGKPRYNKLGNPSFTIWAASNSWGLWEGAIALYYVLTTADTPPSTGWIHVPAQGQIPNPTMSGGEACLVCISPQLSGNPPATVLTKSSYHFAPTSSGTCEIALYTVTNLPSWARFDSSTGKLSGTPD